MKIGDIARKTGVSIRMLRYYEAEGLIAPDRTTAGYRDFTSSDADTISTIRLLGGAGLTLSEIKDFLPCALGCRGAFEPCEELKTKLRMRIAAIETQARKLEAGRSVLADLLTAFEASTPSGIDHSMR